MKEINQAYEILKDAKKRAEYDKRLTSFSKPKSPRRSAEQNSSTERIKLTIDRDHDAEEAHGIEIEACTAYYKSKRIKVLGELISTTGSVINKYKEVQVVVYNIYGDILARGYTNWGQFGVRQSFELDLDNEDSSYAPSTVKVFPAGRF